MWLFDSYWSRWTTTLLCTRRAAYSGRQSGRPLPVSSTLAYGAHLLYDGFPITHLNLITALGGIAIVVCLVLLWRLRRIDSGLGLGTFSITFILPVLHIVPLGTIAAERYLYLPLRCRDCLGEST